MFLFQNWIFIAILAGLASNAFNFLSRFILKDNDDPIIYAWYLETLKFLIFITIAIFDWKLTLNTKSVIIFILLGLTEWLAVYFFVKMHSFSHLSISSIISRTRLIWVAVIAFFVLGENLKISEYFGILILFTGLSFVIAPRKFFIDKGAMYASIGAFITALNNVILKMALPYGSNSVLNAIMILPVILIFPLFIKNFGIKLHAMKQTNWSLKTFAPFLNAIALYLFIIALRIGEASKVNAIYQGMLIFSVLAGIIFLKERENIGKKLIGTGVTIIGVLLLTST